MDHAFRLSRKQVVDGIACEIARQHFFNLVSLHHRAQTHARPALAPLFVRFIYIQTHTFPKCARSPLVHESIKRHLLLRLILARVVSKLTRKTLKVPKCSGTNFCELGAKW
jgi:hypothetical protein